MSALVLAWQGALAQEERSVFGYGLLGPYLVIPAQISQAGTCLRAHAELRDVTIAALVAAGQPPPAPPADYPELYPVSRGRSAVELAVRLEQDAARAWRYLYAVAASTPGAQARSLRPLAQRALIDSAVRATTWRQAVTPATATVAFPGI